MHRWSILSSLIRVPIALNRAMMVLLVYRALPEPLLTKKLHDQWISAWKTGKPTLEQCVQALPLYILFVVQHARFDYPGNVIPRCYDAYY